MCQPGPKNIKSKNIYKSCKHKTFYCNSWIYAVNIFSISNLFIAFTHLSFMTGKGRLEDGKDTITALGWGNWGGNSWKTSVRTDGCRVGNHVPTYCQFEVLNVTAWTTGAIRCRRHNPKPITVHNRFKRSDICVSNCYGQHWSCGSNILPIFDNFVTQRQIISSKLYK